MPDVYLAVEPANVGRLSEGGSDLKDGVGAEEHRRQHKCLFCLQINVCEAPFSIDLVNLEMCGLAFKKVLGVFFFGHELGLSKARVCSSSF